MKSRPAFLMQALVMVVLAAATAFVVVRMKGGSGDAAAEGSEADFHQWMHEQLDISAEQHAALEPHEMAFEDERDRLRTEMREAGRELAAAVRDGDPDSARINAALSRLNDAREQLQRATLGHFFAMKEHLDPEQADKLLQWTHDSIVHE